jgi:hypothetical protein
MSLISVICLRLLLFWERLRRHAGNCELLRSFFKSSERKNVRQGVLAGSNLRQGFFKKSLSAFNNQPRTGADEGNPTV